MKEAEEIINRSEEWVNEDQKNRAAVVILADEKENAEWGHSAGRTHRIGRLIYSLMAENKELGHDIYVFACIYAHKHLTEEERGIINAVISASVEARKKPKGGEK